MKCTEMYNLQMALQTVALNELENALKVQEDQSFKWDTTYGPMAILYGDCISHVSITHIWLEGGLHIVGWDMDACEEVEVNVCEMTPMDILFIVENMMGAGDVSTPNVQEKIDELTNFLKSL